MTIISTDLSCWVPIWDTRTRVPKAHPIYVSYGVIIGNLLILLCTVDKSSWYTYRVLRVFHRHFLYTHPRITTSNPNGILPRFPLPATIRLAPSPYLRLHRTNRNHHRLEYWFRPWSRLSYRVFLYRESHSLDIVESTKWISSTLEVWELDFSSSASMKVFVTRMQGLERLDAVVLNTGILTIQFKLVVENKERSIVVNVVYNTLLVLLLLPKMKESTVKTRPRKLICHVL